MEMPRTANPNSRSSAYCAADQDKFWEYHDIFFANQNGEMLEIFPTNADCIR
jgi:hypothetical protein